MIIWRGWGIVAILCAAAGFALSNAMFSGHQHNGFLGIGLMIGGLLCFPLGWWLNVLRPAKKAEMLAQEIGPEQASIVGSQLRNRHSLFFPMQFIGVLFFIGGLVAVVMWLVQGT